MCTAKMNASQRQEFCVRWNSHLGSIGAAFPQLLAGQRFVDVTLACDGHQVHCHRLVLAACSSYFEAILAENPCKHPVIILPSEIKLWEIQALVDFMYKGEVNVTQAGLPQLLRCAEQLRIRGLYGSDAALNLNQLKQMTSKAAVAAASVGAATSSQQPLVNSMNDGVETDEATTSSTTTTTTTNTATSVVQLQQQQQQQQQKQQRQTHPPEMGQSPHGQLVVKKELQEPHMNGPNALAYAAALHQQQNHQMQLLQQQQQQQQQQQHHQHQRQHHRRHQSANNSNAATEDDDSADESTPNAYPTTMPYEPKAGIAALAAAGASAAAAIGTVHMQQLDSTIEDDHNYVAAHDDDDSYGTGGDTEHESSVNSSALLQSSIDANASFKRVRRSEASLAQAAKCVSKGETFQTVSNMFNIPVSTIRFYMARKGILPKRKRGRGASSSSSANASSVMSQALAHMKRSGTPPGAMDSQYHSMLSYKLNEPSPAANMI